MDFLEEEESFMSFFLTRSQIVLVRYRFLLTVRPKNTATGSKFDLEVRFVCLPSSKIASEGSIAREI